ADVHVPGLVESQVVRFHRCSVDVSGEERGGDVPLRGDAVDLSAGEVGQVQAVVIRTALCGGVGTGAVGEDGRQLLAVDVHLHHRGCLGGCGHVGDDEPSVRAEGGSLQQGHPGFLVDGAHLDQKGRGVLFHWGLTRVDGVRAPCCHTEQEQSRECPYCCSPCFSLLFGC